MRTTTRFACPSVSLGLSALLRRTTGVLWVCLGLGVAIHLSFTAIRSLEAEQKTAKPLTTQFVKRQPRLTKPLELKKRPQPKRRQVQREMVAVEARRQREQAGARFQAAAALGGLARPQVGLDRVATMPESHLDPRAVAERIQGAKDTEQRVDMTLELLEVDALNTGRYQALVIQDASDKRKIKGFFRLMYAYSESYRGRDIHNNENRLMQSMRALLDGINEYTDIEATFGAKILFTAPEMRKTPWVFTNVWQPFEFTPQECTVLGEYLMSGGFMLWDAIDLGIFKGHDVKRYPSSLNASRYNLKRALATQGFEHGLDWTFETLPNAHPLYHCFFDFDGPPASWYDTELVLSGNLEGINVGGRLLVAISQKVFQYYWDDPEHPELRSERMIQFGINTIIFALTQEGSITHQLLDNIQ